MSPWEYLVSDWWDRSPCQALVWKSPLMFGSKHEAMTAGCLRIKDETTNPAVGAYLYWDTRPSTLFPGKEYLQCHYENPLDEDGTNPETIYRDASSDWVCSPPIRVGYLNCPNGFDAAQQDCIDGEAPKPEKNFGSCSDNDGGKGAPASTTAHPINITTGNKYWTETDVSLPAPSPLRFVRHYNSGDREVISLALGWRHNYEARIRLEADRRRADGR